MKKLQKVLSKSSLYLQIINVNSTLCGTLEILDYSFKVKIMANITAALFTKVIVRLVKTMSVNPWEMLFYDDLNMKTQISNRNHLNTWKYFPDHQFEWKVLRQNFLLVTRYFLLVTFYSLLINFHPLLDTFYSLFVTFYSVLFTLYSLLFTRCSLLWLITRCYLLVTRCYLLGTHYVLFVLYCIIFTMFTLNFTSVPEKENTSPNRCFSSVGRYDLLWCRFECI